MTAVRTARGWLTGHDPGLVALRKALRVTVAACVGFFVCQYLLGLSTLATYAVFGTIAFGVLSDVSGPPAQRTRTYLGAWPVALVLVAIGTATARSTPAAVVGMLVVGFAVAFAGVGGPRIAGVANGLQLFYVLPCFPPYDPASLAPAAHRAHDRHRARRGRRPAAVARGCAGAVPHAARRRRRRRRPLRHRAARRRPAGGGRSRGAGVAPERPAPGDPADRPGPPRPGVDPRHGRAAHDAGARPAARAPAARPGRPAARAAAGAVLTATGDALARCSAALRGTGQRPGERAARRGRRGVPRGPRRADGGPAHRRRAAAGCADRRAHRRGRRRRPRAGLRRAVGHGRAARHDRRRRRRPGTSTCRPRCCGGAGCAAHFTPRSVYFQNAVRLALGLAAARLAADLLDLSHGFWVLLATLSLMRTSAVASGLALIPAFLGTLAGRARGRGRADASSATTRSSTPSCCRSPWSSRSPPGPSSGPPRPSSASRSSSRCCSPSWRPRRGSWPRRGSPTSSSAGWSARSSASRSGRAAGRARSAVPPRCAWGRRRTSWSRPCAR